MERPDWKGPLGAAFDHATTYLGGLPDRPVRPSASLEELRAALGGPLPAGPLPPERVVAELIAAAEPGIMASSSGRFFGFVVGGATPAALAADWLTSAWDQNAGLYVLGPAASVVEETAATWLLDVLGLPARASVGYVTGGQMANFTALAIAVREVLRRDGWDVDADGLWGAPRVRVIVGQGRHGTIDRALRHLGMGTNCVVPVAMDAQGRMVPEALAEALEGGRAIVCAQAGNVNTGAIDPLGAIADLCAAAGAWLHVDGAFGLWAAASPRMRPLLAGVERADSWSTDAHKWLNVPYDSGLVICAHPAAHRAAMGVRASYLQHAEGGERDQVDYNPEHSRRARGFAVYAAMRQLGRDGIAALVDRSCELARRFARRLSAGGAEILNEVVLNQVLVRLGSDDETRRALLALQGEGTTWMSGTTWNGSAAIRISVSNWSTDEDDVDRTVAAIEACRSRGVGNDGG
uniref:pyridoxal phosphate-dependent decarboxylase family protein n=1 Tax=Paractinoplanes polyasparticus TaxID=2856853 RepID=UPI001C856C75|nr:aminotransferase class V-fold PLP-dependent enzyme [Actinoplanes polyasparticus]